MRRRSSATAPISIASAPSEIRSPAPFATMWRPSSSPVFASITVFAKPSVSLTDSARPSAANGNLPTLTVRPFAFASSSVSPVEAISALLYAATRQAAGGMNEMAIAAIENALVDIKAKALGIPVL